MQLSFVYVTLVYVLATLVSAGRIAEYADTEQRELKVTNSGHHLKISSDRKATSSKNRDRFSFSFINRGFPRFRTRYHSNEDNVNEMVTLRAGLLSISEITDGQSPSTSTNVLDFKALNNDDWTDIEVTEKEKDGMTYTEATTSHTTSDNCIITLTMDVSGTSVDLDSSVELTPNALKFSVKIEHWVFKASDTKLALSFVIQSRQHRNVKGEDDVPAVETDDGVRFEWIPQVEVDGVNVDIGVSDVADDTEDQAALSEDPDAVSDESAQIMYFIVPRGDVINWDPTVGFSSAGLMLMPGLLSLGVALCIAALNTF